MFGDQVNIMPYRPEPRAFTGLTHPPSKCTITCNEQGQTIVANSSPGLHPNDTTPAYSSSINDAPVDGMGLTALLNANCRTLTTLNLRDCYWVDDTVLAAISDSCHHLQELNLSAAEICTTISQEALAQVAHRCTSLLSVNLR